jgi:hypothetical protein
VKQVISNVVENCLQPDKPINVDQINEFTNKLVDDTMKELLKLKKLFKYAVTVFVQQKNGSAMNFGGIEYNFKLFLIAASYIEDSSDGSVTCAIHDHPHVDVMISIAGYKITQK